MAVSFTPAWVVRQGDTLGQIFDVEQDALDRAQQIAETSGTGPMDELNVIPVTRVKRIFE